MALQVTHGALLACSFGTAVSPLQVLPSSTVASSLPVATVMEHNPLINILPFGLCSCPANPAVASATAAAFGVLTPMPCLPQTVTPWVPGSVTVLIGGAPALQDTSALQCCWGGTIRTVAPVQASFMIP